MENIYKIGGNTIIRIFTNSITEKFWNNGIQYVHADENSWNNAVWVANIIDKNGQIINEIAHYRNKIYSNNGLLPLPSINNATEMVANKFEIMLKQGFRFSNNGIVGLHCIIVDLESEEVLLSQFLSEDDFKITSNKLYINGSFWMTKADVYIPKTSGLLGASITEITADDINPETGFIYNFNSPSEPLINKKELVKTIQTKVEFDENFYLTISFNTIDNNKSVEQAFIDYIGHEPSDINVSHTIHYGNDDINYKEIKISNEVNKFAPIKIGLDLSSLSSDSSVWENNENYGKIEISVTTNIVYDNNPVTRENILIADVRNTILPIITELTKKKKPDTLYPVEVVIKHPINQTVVETNIDRQVIQVLQPTFCEMIKESFAIKNKRISFEKFNQPGYLVIAETNKLAEQILKAEVTVEGTYYFDLSKLIPVDEDTTYTLYDEQQKMILGNGIVYKKEPEESDFNFLIQGQDDDIL